jgi:biotin operon repressor
LGVFDIIDSDRQASVIALKYQLKRAFSKIKEEFSQHLESINENTNELQANYEYLSELETHVDKLSGRIEHIELFLKKLDDSFRALENTEGYTIQPLSVNEKRIFAIVYSANKPLSYPDIASALSMSESLVRSYLTNIISKGVPIIKKYLGGKPIISLDEEFKKLQQKENIIKLSQKQLDTFYAP